MLLLHTRQREGISFTTYIASEDHQVDLLN